MKRFIQRHAKALFLCLLVLMAATGYAQNGEPAAAFPIILIAPYFLGVLAHWFKKWSMEGVTLNFVQWLIQNIAWTIGSLVAGITAVWTIFGSSPGAFIPVTIGSWIIVFTTAMAADTINSGGTKST